MVVSDFVRVVVSVTARLLWGHLRHRTRPLNQLGTPGEGEELS